MYRGADKSLAKPGRTKDVHVRSVMVKGMDSFGYDSYGWWAVVNVVINLYGP